MRPILAAIPALLLAAAAFAAGPDEVRLSALAPGAEQRPIPASAVVDGPGAVLAAVAGVEEFPVPCATTILQAAEPAGHGSALRRALALVSAMPGRPDDRLVTTRDDRFVLRVPAAGSFRESPGPEFVARAAEALVASRAYLVGSLGYPDPVPGPERLTVVLTGLGRGLEGYIVPGRPGARPAAAFMVLDAGLPADRIMPAVLHQMAHLALPPAARTGIGWSEAAAAFLTLAGTGDLEAQRRAIGAWLAESARGVEDDALLRMQGGLVWPLFLAERTGDADVLRQIAAEMAAQADLDPAAATDLVLRRGWGLSRAAALREMAVWNLRTGSRDDGRHYAGGAALPEAPLPVLGPGLPLVIGPVEPIAAGGSVAFRLPADGGRGSLDVAIEGEGGRPAADLLVFYPGEEDPALVPVDLGTGPGQVSLPWSEARELWIVLRNDAAGAGAPARFDLRLGRDPLAPFDLATFTAAAAGRAVTLEWVTASERGLVGWNVLRAAAPEGPFTRINAVAVPAWGDGNADTGYVFVDEGARPGRRYYYVLEGLTAAGLVERSHMASARAAGR